MPEEFPTWSQIAGYHGMFLVSGPLAIVVGIVLSVRALIVLIRNRHAFDEDQLGKPIDKAKLRVVMSGLVFGIVAMGAFLIGAVHLVGTYGWVRNGLNWRVDPNEIAEIEVKAFRGDSLHMERVGSPITISDSAIISEGFTHLRHAEPFHPQHEHFVEGYHIRLKLRGARGWSQRYLWIHNQTNCRSGLSVVIPHTGPGRSGSMDFAGEYSSEDFHAWFREKVLPKIGE